MSADRSIRTAAAEAGVPAKRLSGRQVVVLLGASEPALSVLSRALQALGVDMLDAPQADATAGPSAAGDSESPPAPLPAWRREWISDLNRRMLQAIDRSADHFAHALPFPPGWWRRPAVQALKREAIAALEAALDGHDELWGFADLTTARLLPVWEDVFERLGLAPAYVWSLTHPAKAPAASGLGAAEAAGGAAAAEVRWFAYGADIFRYGADHLACVVDEGDWRSDPQGLMERLVEHLHLRWRGTRLDLYETVGAVLAQGMGESGDDTGARPATLPLSMSFYRAARVLDEEPDARDRLKTMVESAELLRPLIAPFLPALDRAGPSGGEEVAILRQEIAALRETVAGLRHLAASSAPAPAEEPPAAAAQAPSETSAPPLELELELQSRVAEIRWLHDRHAAELAEAQEEIEALRRQLAGSGEAVVVAATPGASNDSGELAQLQAEIARLQAEMVTLTNANERYLARIYELKKALEDHGAFERVGR